MDSFLGEIRIFAFNFAPKDWALCDGSSLSVRQNPDLFRVIGNVFGGDGVNTFNLPNLTRNVAMGGGAGGDRTPRKLGDKGGTFAETITVQTMPLHTHSFGCDVFDVANLATPAPNRVFAQSFNINAYQPDNSSRAPMAIDMVSTVWQANPAAHSNVQPYLPMLFCISLSGAKG